MNRNFKLNKRFEDKLEKISQKRAKGQRDRKFKIKVTKIRESLQEGQQR